MKTIKILFIVLLITPFNSFLYSQGKDEFKPSYTLGGIVFSGWQYNIDNADFISRLDTSAVGIDNNSAFGYKPTAHQFEISKNTFYIDRAYIDLKAVLTPQIKARLTPDFYSFTDGGGKTQYAYQIKFAYADYTPFSIENGTSLTFTLGVNSNQWVPNMDKYWGYRFVSKTLTDYPWVTSAVKSGNTVLKTTSTYFSTADLGLTAKLTLPEKYADLYIAIVNGNGFRNLSFDNRFKDVQITSFIYPLSKYLADKTEKYKKEGKLRLDGISDLTLGGFVYLGKLDKGENYTGAQYKRNRFGGMISAKYNFKKAGFIKLGGEFSVQNNEDPVSDITDASRTTDARGISAFMEFNPPVESLNEKLSLTARYDVFDPNTANDALVSAKGFNSSNDQQSLLILGLFYRPAKVLGFGLSYQMTKFDGDFTVNYDGTVSNSLGRLFFNTVLEF
ncbi:MAG: hypothetical protein JST15_03075 [Bacteroidetes bacterium]|nr:hypothetical protein [Bacteroidota bacterium]